MSISIEKAGDAPPPSGAQPATAGIRFIARWFDLALLSTIAGALFAYFLPQYVPDDANTTVFTLISIPLGLALEVIIYILTGTTPGKALTGLRLTTNDGRRVPPGTMFGRQFQLWWQGLALGFPIIFLFTASAAGKRIRQGEKTGWDEAGGTQVWGNPSTARRWIAGAMMATLVFALAALNVALEQNPQILGGVFQREVSAENLEEEARAAKPKEPVEVSPGVTWVDVTADPGPTLSYHYIWADVTTATGTKASRSAALRADLSKTALPSYCENKDGMGLRQAGIAVRYIYRD